MALLGHSTVELGGRSGNLAWHAPTNDYRKTKFSCRRTRIAGISQSKFVPTVANDLRRKMRGWMRVGVELLPHPDSAINPAASNGTVKIDSVEVFMASSLLLLPGHNFQFVWRRIKGVDLSWTCSYQRCHMLLSCITTRMMSYGASPHVSLACGVQEHLQATADEGKSFIFIVDRKQLWRIPARLLLRNV